MAEIESIDGRKVIEIWKSSSMSRAERYYAPKDLFEKIQVSEGVIRKLIFHVDEHALVMRTWDDEETAPASLDIYEATDTSVSPELLKDKLVLFRNIEPIIPSGFEESHQRYPVSGSERLENCPKCRGQGTIICAGCKGAGEVTCSRCGGRGYIVVSTPEGPEETDCPTCGGSGVVVCGYCKGAGELPCEYCAATGKIWRYRVINFEFKHLTEAHDVVDEDLKFVSSELEKLPKEGWVAIDEKTLEGMSNEIPTAHKTLDLISSFVQRASGEGQVIRTRFDISMTNGLLVSAEYSGKPFLLGAVGRGSILRVKSKGMPLDPSKVRMYKLSRALALLFLLFGGALFLGIFVPGTPIDILYQYFYSYVISTINAYVILPLYVYPIVFIIIAIAFVLKVPAPPE